MCAHISSHINPRFRFHRAGSGIIVFLALFVILVSCLSVYADTINGKTNEMTAVPDDSPVTVEHLPAGTRLIRDVPYGYDPRQTFDVYLPRETCDSPVIFMVHGGAWVMGDKTARSVVQNKAARWIPKGFIFISVNYRLFPKATPDRQVEDIAKALAKAQSMALSWGGDKNLFILMGHSAGAHLVTLLTVSPIIAQNAGVLPWLGTVSLDCSVYDIPMLMNGNHPGFYDKPFGKDPEYWEIISPIHVLSQAGPPLIAVCSSQRTYSCPQAARFCKKATSLGMIVSTVEIPLSHSDINRLLGTDCDYTHRIESFFITLDRTIAMRFMHETRGKIIPVQMVDK